MYSGRPQTTHEVPCTARAVGLSYTVWGVCETQKKTGVPCMSYFGTVSSLMQSVDIHDLWGGLTDGLRSTLGSARSRSNLVTLSAYAALTSVKVLEMTRRRDCLMTPHLLIWSFGPKIGSVDGICHQTDSMNRFYLDV